MVHSELPFSNADNRSSFEGGIVRFGGPSAPEATRGGMTFAEYFTNKKAEV